MRVRSLVLRALAALVVLAGPVLGYLAAAHRTASAAPQAHHVYRLDYVVTVHEPGKPDRAIPYEMNVEEGNQGELHAGANIPLGVDSSRATSPRQDVGLKITGYVTRVGERLLLRSDVEMSTTGEGAGEGPWQIRKLSTSDRAVLALGKPAVVFRLEEPASRARYEVEVEAAELL